MLAKLWAAGMARTPTRQQQAGRQSTRLGHTHDTAVPVQVTSRAESTTATLLWHLQSHGLGHLHVPSAFVFHP